MFLSDSMIVLYNARADVRGIRRCRTNGCRGDCNGSCCPASSHAGDQQDQED